ncbi:hypothetical protein [Flammeovirga kamogawensis]|uniref:DUF4270 domain-containing protein n=1 Tax=Flammeovirga kamogawensis TaxID=373891 RepID=A0ABX8H0G3_9BACT|nr:hypothetical protein [Flammeovirga kamogawensis]MBB6462295.1 hypothetical protein [Flammeovirga kamogawensis]QWG09315.1 hypothetical protein KM029_22170 [Flammeovirga kamogawensis]TRX64837.1 hypothetical protein EO216_20080 [Flammeovirga kamogawensis]
MKVNYIIALLLFVSFFSCDKDSDNLDPTPETYLNKISIDDVAYELNEYESFNITVTGNYAQNISDNVEESGILLSTLENGKIDDNTSLSVNLNTTDNTFSHSYDDMYRTATYYINTYVKGNNGAVYYGTPEKLVPPSTLLHDQRSLTFSNLSTLANAYDYVSIKIGADLVLIGEIPTTYGLEYSKNEDFTNSYKSIEDEALTYQNSISVSAIELSVNTKYYVRIYAIYDDNKEVKSETFEVTTAIPEVGDLFPIQPDEYITDVTTQILTSSYLVYKIDATVITLVSLSEYSNSATWTAGDQTVEIRGVTQTVQRPTEAFLREMYTIEDTNSRFALNKLTLVYFKYLRDKYYATSEEDTNDNSKTIEYNPVTNTTRLVDKNLSSGERVNRYVKLLNY